MITLGLGEAAYAPTADALPLDLAPPNLSGRYTALHQLAWGISGAIAPTLCAVLVRHGRFSLWVTLGLLSLGLATAYTIAERSIGERLRSSE
jgi:MFS family permease